MALKLEELQVLISANADQFKGELLSVRNELRKLNSSAKAAASGFGGAGLFGNILKANLATSIITGTVSKAAGTMKGLVREIINGGSAYSRLTIATETIASNLGLTSEQVKQLRDDLAEANTYGINAENVIRTLALSGLIDMSKSLKAVDARTGEAVEGVTALTLAMKDLSAANAIDSNEGIEKLTKFIQRGQASFADGLFELGNLNREYKDFAKSIGKTRENLTAQEEAQARLNIVMREAEKVFGAYANTYQTSGKAISSIRDIVQSLTQMIGKTFEPVLRVGSNAILQFFISIRNALMASEASIGNFANRVAGYMVALIRLIGRLLMRLPFIGKYFKNLANFTVKPIQALNNVRKGADGVGNAMDDAGKSVRNLKDELAGLASFDEMNVLTTPTDGSSGGSGAELGGVSGGDVSGGGVSLEDSSDEIMKYAEQAERVFSKIGSFMKKLAENPIVAFLLDVAKYAGLAFLAFKALSPVIGLVGAALGVITSPITLVILGITALVTAFKLAYDNSEQFRNSIDQLVNGVLTWIQENIAPVFEKFIQKVQELVAVFQEKWPAIQAAIQPLVDAIANFLAGAFQLLGKVIDWLWKNILKPLADFILDNIVPAFSIAIDIITGVIKIFSDLASKVVDLVMPILNALWEVFTQVFDGIKSVVEFVWDNVLKPIFTAVWDLITKLIIPVIQNLLVIWRNIFNGIRSIAEAVWAKILEAVRPVIDWFNNNIMPVINKVKEGMEKAFSKIKDTATGIWEGIKAGFKNGINAVIEFVNGFIRKINGLIAGVNSVVTKIPGVSAIEFRVGEIPKLATGGLIRKPVVSQLGEGSFREAVLPLDRNTEWAEILADRINQAGGSGGNTQPIVIKVGEDTIYQGLIDFANRRALETNSSIFNV